MPSPGHRDPLTVHPRIMVTERITALAVLGMILLLIGLATAPPDAAALVICSPIKRATGEVREGATLRLRTSCKPNETALAPASLGLQGPAGNDGADGIDGLSCWDRNESFTCDIDEDISPPIGCGVEDCAGIAPNPVRPVLVAANGAEVGEFVGEPILDSSTKYILHHAVDAVIPATLAATSSGAFLSHTSAVQPSVSFTGADCTGDAYVTNIVGNPSEISFYPATFQSPPLAASLSLPGNAIFYYTKGVLSAFEVQVQSERTGLPLSPCQNFAPWTRKIYEVGVFDHAVFLPPFTIEDR